MNTNNLLLRFQSVPSVAAKERPHHENLGLRPSARPSKQRVTSGNRLEGQGYHLGPVMHTWLALRARRVSITSHK
jgi:hypothetical protein